jgi:hypothetical protein
MTPEAYITQGTVGFCIDEQLQPYRLSISGNGGCTPFNTGFTGLRRWDPVNNHRLPPPLGKRHFFQEEPSNEQTGRDYS